MNNHEFLWEAVIEAGNNKEHSAGVYESFDRASRAALKYVFGGHAAARVVPIRMSTGEREQAVLTYDLFTLDSRNRARATVHPTKESHG